MRFGLFVRRWVKRLLKQTKQTTQKRAGGGGGGGGGGYDERECGGIIHVVVVVVGIDYGPCVFCVPAHYVNAVVMWCGVRVGVDDDPCHDV